MASSKRSKRRKRGSRGSAAERDRYRSGGPRGPERQPAPPSPVPDETPDDRAAAIEAAVADVLAAATDRTIAARVHADDGHVPIMPAEITRHLAPPPGGVAVDLTAGRGGHAAMLGRLVGPGGTVVVVDLDPENLAYAAERVRATGATVHALHAGFDAAPAAITDLGLAADVVLADLGFASSQIDDPARGFSFAADGPLDMRLDPTDSSRPTAAELVATLPEPELADLIFRYGEEPLGRKIARFVAAARDERPIETTEALAEVVRAAYGPRAARARTHPATRTFMALRIAVNDELGALEALLEAIERAATEAAPHGAGTLDGGPLGRGPSTQVSARAPDPARGPDDGTPAPATTWLRADARIAVIAFHSLEDRAVKQAFRDLEDRGLGRRITRKPLVASTLEVDANARARSAKLRIARLGCVTD